MTRVQEARLATLSRFIDCHHLAMATKQAGKQANKQAITLKGSATLVTEFFKYAVNTCVTSWAEERVLITHYRILFQREVYPSDDFHMVKKYGQTVLVTQDLALESYLERSVSLLLP